MERAERDDDGLARVAVAEDDGAGAGAVSGDIGDDTYGGGASDY